MLTLLYPFGYTAFLSVIHLSLIFSLSLSFSSSFDLVKLDARKYEHICKWTVSSASWLSVSSHRGGASALLLEKEGLL